MMKPLAIIGLDPGITTAYVVLGLDGKAIKLFSAKELSLSEVITQIIEIAQPVITSTDKAKVPAFVEEFSRKMGTQLITPPEDLGKEEKRLIVKEHFSEKPFQNDHESDCLAAALFAYKKYLPKFNKINKFISEHNMEAKRNEFFSLAIKDEALNFSVIRNLLNKPTEESKIINTVISENKITKKDFLNVYHKLIDARKQNELLQNGISQLKREVSSLKKANLLLNKKNNNFNLRVDSLLKFKEERLKVQEKHIDEAKKQANVLNEKINSLLKFIEKMPNYQLVKKLDSLSKKEFNAKNKVLNIGDNKVFGDNEVLLVKEPNIYSKEIIDKLIHKNIIILSLNQVKYLGKLFLFAQVSPEEIVLENEYFALLDRKNLENKLNQKEFIEKIINEYKEKRRGG